MGFYKWPQSGPVSLHLSRQQRLVAETGPGAWQVLPETGSLSLLAWATGLVTEKQEQKSERGRGTGPAPPAGEGQPCSGPGVKRCELIWSCLCPHLAV